MSLNLRQLQKERQKIMADMAALKTELEALDVLIVRASRGQPSVTGTVTVAQPTTEVEGFSLIEEAPVVVTGSSTVDKERSAIAAVVATLSGNFTKGVVAKALKDKFQSLNITDQAVSYHLFHMKEKKLLRVVELGKGGKQSVYAKAS